MEKQEEGGLQAALASLESFTIEGGQTSHRASYHLFLSQRNS